MSRNAKLSEGEVREIAARSLIVAGIGSNPAADIEGVMKLLEQRGVKQDGQDTRLVFAHDAPRRGKPQIGVTTALHAHQEARLIALARAAHEDRSGALAPAAIEREAKRSGLSFEASHGRAQREMMEPFDRGRPAGGRDRRRRFGQGQSFGGSRIGA